MPDFVVTLNSDGEEQTFTCGGPLEVGRQQFPAEPSGQLLPCDGYLRLALVKTEGTLSRKHALIEPLSPARARVRNLNSVNPLHFAGPAGSPLPPGETREVDLPFSVLLGASSVLTLRPANAPRPLRHFLFDDASLYRRLLGSARAPLKMLGYFHALAARADLLRLPPSSPRPEGERLELADRLAGDPTLAGIDFAVLDAITVDAEVIVLGTAEATGRPIAAKAELCLVRGAGDSRSVHLLVPLNQAVRHEAGCSLPEPFRCQAFLLEPEVVRRLEQFFGGNCLRAFETEPIAADREAIELLAVACKLEGECLPFARAVQLSVALPGRFDLFPPRSVPPRVVVAMHPAGDSRDDGWN